MLTNKFISIIIFIFFLIPLIKSDIFDLSLVSNLSYTFNSSRTSQIFFSPAQAPVSPKVNGGYYISYQERTTKKLHVLEFDSTDKLVKDTTLPFNAVPFDIIETDKGFAIYAVNSTNINHAFLLIYDFKYNKIAQTNIMNNGEGTPTTTKEAIVFYNSAGSPLFGLNAMFKPNNGKLAYGNKRINLIFAHYNNFEDSGGHTGDTYYSFDTNGDKSTVKLAWNWQSSHSLIQSHIFDGNYFVTVALGDAYPKGLTFSVIDTNKSGGLTDKTRNYDMSIKYYSNNQLVKTINGNSIGNSLGRLGGLMKFENFYATIYSIKKDLNETRDGIFLTKFILNRTTIKLVETKNILNGVAGKLVNLRCAKYGKNILITYIHNSKDYGTDYASYYQYLQEKMYYVICDTNGKVLIGPLEAPTQHQALNEDIRPLKDGSLRWGYIDSKNELKIVKVKLSDEQTESSSTSAFKVILISVIIILIICICVFLFFRFKNKNFSLKIPFLS